MWLTLTLAHLPVELIPHGPRPLPYHIIILDYLMWPGIPNNLRASYQGGHSKDLEVTSQEPGRRPGLSFNKASSLLPSSQRLRCFVQGRPAGSLGFRPGTHNIQVGRRELVDKGRERNVLSPTRAQLCPQGLAQG